ncbi:MAG: MBL fold metallo-hydrolase, partial [Pseudomonadota bacterium]
FALDHVNNWILDDGDSFTVIDTGHGNPDVQAMWDHALAGPLAAKPIGQIVVTHFHPDHAGNAGWLCARSAAPLIMTELEFFMTRALELDDRPGYADAAASYFTQAGAPAEVAETMRQRGNPYRRGVTEPPRSFTRVRHGHALKIAGSVWEIMIGRGHAPEMICLFCAERNVLIAADQLLPRITPVIGAWQAMPEADPISDFIASNLQFRELPEDVLVLPSHGRPYQGLHHRLDEFYRHHHDRLAKALELCATTKTAFEVMTGLFDRKLDNHQIGFALAETLAHLNHLVDQGQVQRSAVSDHPKRYRRNS